MKENVHLLMRPQKIDEVDLAAEVADKIVSDSDKDCFSCRLVSGGGLIGAGIYVGYYAPKQPRAGKMILGTISSLLCCLGACRLFNLPPFSEIQTSRIPLRRSNPNDA